MPSLRRRAHSPPIHELPSGSSSPPSEDYISDDASEPLELLEEGQDEEDHLALHSPSPSPLSPSHPLASPIPPHLREISTLASWTVSSSKPGCSIPQLRHPSPHLFWQSDGPQPHFLNIHFFKLVRIVGLRVYLDFAQDESYTPTRIALLAGSGMNDLVEWGEMRLEAPRGWVWADFSGVGDDSEDEDEDEDEGTERQEMPLATSVAGHDDIPIAIDSSSSDHENTAPRAQPPAPLDDPSDLATPLHQHHPRHQHQHQGTPHTTSSLPRAHPRAPFTALSPPSPRAPKRPKMPVLRCHLVQIKILENHQNGKDTHLRGLQIFAEDGENAGGGGRGEDSGVEAVRSVGGQGEKKVRRATGMKRSAWMEEPVLR